MISERITPCSICGQEIIDAKKPTCSERCEAAIDKVEGVLDEIRNHKPVDDPRIFFYDVGFGELCDKLCIFVLRRLWQKSLDAQLETDYLIGRISQSIMTKINKSCHHPKTKESIASLMKQLYAVNSEMWRLRQGTRPGGIWNDDARQKQALAYFDASMKRDLLRAQLDAIVEGRVRTVRVYV